MTARCLDGSVSSSTCSYAATKLIEKGHQSVSRDPTQATDPDRLNRAGTDQRIHDGSSDAKPIGRFFDGKDKRQPELIKLRALPSGALGFPRVAELRVRSAHIPNPFRPQSWGDGLHATRRRLAAAPVSTLGISTDLSRTEMAKPSSQKRCHSAHTRLTCG